MSVEGPGMLRNRHDTWKLFCETHRELLAWTGLPTSVTHSEHRFRDLLEAGHAAVSEGRISLGDLTATGWAALYQFVAVFFREFESYAPADLFLAFRNEVQQRGDNFPR
jgi:hypothetical protein